MHAVFDQVHQRYASETPGVCMGAIAGHTRAFKCYGKLAPGSSRSPTGDSLFQIGSISKTFAATLLALRAQQGTVALTDPLRTYIPVGDRRADVPASMTLVDMANHYSGLPRKFDQYFPAFQVTSLDRFLSEVGRCEAARPSCPAATPGSGFLYSNFAFGILGQALAHNDNFGETTYSAWERDNNANITGPLGMTSTRTWFGWKAHAPMQFSSLRARGSVGNPPHVPNPEYFAAAPYTDSAGGLYSSSRDMLKWLSYSMGLTGPTALSAAHHRLYEDTASIRSRKKPFDARKEIGLAWNIDVHGSGTTKTTCISKDGASPGFRAYMVFVKGQRRGAFVMVNAGPSNPGVGTIGTDLINSLPPASSTSHSSPTCGTVPASPDL